MESRLSGHDVPFDLGTDSDNDDGDTSMVPAAYLKDIDNDPATILEDQDWQDQSYAHLAAALNQLDDRSRDILQRRWLDDEKPTLQVLADEYSVSAERIRQIESAAMKKIKQSLTA